ncbi:Predicted arabinose efflux permease, MFS family [Bosea sp. OK403]|uniref:MFS transporter n=1 Tax=Bosea sp. OK403 TaxID=1855286 RepID=UPI0008EF55B5|nr:MFS transporter [Bosea sp. OK403]SFI50337.1 Predicted arabinose efflux permease, MFS family [Bosea sp. OK403]
MTSQARTAGSVWVILWLGAVAFANALGSVMVFPLAPFLADDLRVPAQDVAYTSVYFNGAAGLGGIVGALLLGRIARRSALLGALAGLGLMTGLAALAPNFSWLLLGRLLAGLCAGPLLAVVFATAADLAPKGGRNRAVSAIVGSYGLALLLGSPLALGLISAAGSWRAPFIGMAALCLGLTVPVLLGLPGLSARAAQADFGRTLLRDVGAILLRPGSLTGILLTAGASFATLLISPHIGTFALKNLGASTAELGSIYLIGGGLALLTTGSTGWVMDRIGSRAASLGVGVALTLLLTCAFLLPMPLPVMAPVLGLILAAQLARSTVAQASASRVPRSSERTAYQCLVAAATSLAQAAGAGGSTLLLSERADGHLVGMERLALISILLCWVSLWLVARLERQIGRSASLIDASR